MSTLTMKHLRYFEALARHRHFGRAAEASSISQPALSLQIKELEDILGAPLVERGPRQIRLTALGEDFSLRARDILRAVDELAALGRFGTEAETSAAIVYLLSPAASFVSGSTLRIDGARPQVRMGWPMRVADEKIQARDAIKPFNGFHRGTVPKVFAPQPPKA